MSSKANGFMMVESNILYTSILQISLTIKKLKSYIRSPNSQSQIKLIVSRCFTATFCIHLLYKSVQPLKKVKSDERILNFTMSS